MRGAENGVKTAGAVREMAIPNCAILFGIPVVCTVGEGARFIEDISQGFRSDRKIVLRTVSPWMRQFQGAESRYAISR